MNALTLVANRRVAICVAAGLAMMFAAPDVLLAGDIFQTRVEAQWPDVRSDPGYKTWMGGTPIRVKLESSTSKGRHVLYQNVSLDYGTASAILTPPTSDKESFLWIGSVFIEPQTHTNATTGESFTVYGTLTWKMVTNDTTSLILPFVSFTFTVH